MKTINVTFDDKEIKTLLKRKGERNWHDFILEIKKGDINGEGKD